MISDFPGCVNIGTRILNNRLNFTQFLYSDTCVLCGANGQYAERTLCKPCHDHLPRLPAGHCPVCLLPVAGGLVCGACLSDPPAFSHIVAALDYAFPVDALIHSLKYGGNLPMATVLANLLLTVIDHDRGLPDVIVPMPLHPLRLRERGFNQSLEIARILSARTGIPLLHDTCQRVRDTPSQTALPWKARRENIRGAFSCSDDLTGKHVVIVDDVLTTGATLNELAQVLRNHHAAEASGWVIARTLPRHD